jgi:hypothetical protein
MATIAGKLQHWEFADNGKGVTSNGPSDSVKVGSLTFEVLADWLRLLLVVVFLLFL